MAPIGLLWIPLATALLPIIAIHGTYLLSAAEGFVPWCFPYIDSCTSISATGRHGTAYFVFKGTMIPAATLLVLYWGATGYWLRQLGDTSRTPLVIMSLGTVAAIFLVVYTVALGAAGETMQLQRRIGIVIYFGFTALCELLLIWRLSHTRYRQALFWKINLGICCMMLATGLLTVVLQLVMDNYDTIEDAFEWVIALAMHIFILVTIPGWQDSGFRLTFHTGATSEKKEAP